MNKVLRGILNTFVNVDDILVHSQTPKEHRAVFQHFEENGLVVNREKCMFGVLVLIAIFRLEVCDVTIMLPLCLRNRVYFFLL